MPRPRKCRRVEFLPDVTFFNPAGIPLRTLDEVCLSIEEAEAIRLKDLEGLEQEQGAQRMHVSRPTFQRILASARQKVADALLNSKAIQIIGGNFEMAWSRFRCLNGHEWDIPFEMKVGAPPSACPTCMTTSFATIEPVAGNYRSRGHARRRRRSYWKVRND